MRSFDSSGLAFERLALPASACESGLMPKSFRIQAGSDSIAFGAYKALDGHDVLLLDGGMGHELKQRGLEVR